MVRSGTRVRRVAFLVALAILLLITVMLSPLPYAVLGWTLSAEGTSHRVHEVTFGALFLVSAIGTLRLFRRPTPAALYQAVLPLWILLILVIAVDRFMDPFIAMFLVVPAIVAALFPGRRTFTPDAHRILVVLAAVLTVPMLVYAGSQLSTAMNASAAARGVTFEGETPEEFEAEVQRVAADEEEAALLIHSGHWSAMAGFGLIAVALAWLVALRPRGWPWLAVVTGGAVAYFGAVSLSAPSDASAAGPVWAVAAIVWGVAVGAVGVLDRRGPDDDGSDRAAELAPSPS